MSTALLESFEPVQEALINGHHDPEALYEIIDGQKVELPPMSSESTALTNRLTSYINQFTYEKNLGEAYGEMLVKFHLKDQRERIRRPDMIFVSYQKWPADRPIQRKNGWVILPDICVEVISPTDIYEEVDEKIDEYFEAGVPEVWIVNPENQKVRIYESPYQEKILNPEETLIGKGILTGFELPLIKLFRYKLDQLEK